MTNKHEIIVSENLVPDKDDLIKLFSEKWIGNYLELKQFFKKFNIFCTSDVNVIKPYSKDWSNIKGSANLLVQPKNTIECALVLKTCYISNILLTVSAGRTNLTGSATPMGGIILSTNNLTTPKVQINSPKKEALCPVGITLETMRNEILKLSKNNLYYPVDPTSRKDAFIGGTISCNASGFIPGEKGTTRYWVKGLDFLLPNGNLVKIKRNQYFSKDGFFYIKSNSNIIPIPVPTYSRPQIKNASGLYSNKNGIVDFIDLIIGSEGILGLITSCKLGLAPFPTNFLDLFITFKSESDALNFRDFLSIHFNQDFSQITALEYFGYNSQKYMDNNDFFFNKEDDVGIYIQIPFSNDTMENKIEEWISLLKKFNPAINLDRVIVLNDPIIWEKFFKSRHSIPDNALTKTKTLDTISIITDTIVPEKNFRKYLDRVHRKLKNNRIEYLLFGHLGDCHLHFHLIADKAQQAKCLESYNYIIDLSNDLGGVYSAEHGTGKRKKNDFEKFYGSEAVEMVKKTKFSLDPNNYLNRGNLI